MHAVINKTSVRKWRPEIHRSDQGVEMTIVSSHSSVILIL